MTLRVLVVTGLLFGATIGAAYFADHSKQHCGTYVQAQKLNLSLIRDLQRAASQNKIRIDTLAASIRKLNESIAEYAKTANLTAYCAQIANTELALTGIEN